MYKIFRQQLIGNFHLSRYGLLLKFCYNDIVEASATRGMTALVYCLINSSLNTGPVHRWWSTSNWPDGHQGYRCPQGSPKLWPRLGGEEVRGPTSVAVPIDGMGIASMASVMASPVPACKKLLEG